MDRQLAEAMKVLGIPAGSDHNTVTNAYRRLARLTHPDVSSDHDAAERFATITAAYRLVSASRTPLPADPPAGSGPERAPESSQPARARLPLVETPSLLTGFTGRPPLVAGPVKVRGPQRDPGLGHA